MPRAGAYRRGYASAELAQPGGRGDWVDSELLRPGGRARPERAAVAASGDGVASGARAPATGLATREALAESFASDIRSLVYEWDPADPRPAEERQRLLFEFIYQTYQSSAWIPQALFDGNAITQAVAGDVDTIVRDRIGLVLWKENALVPVYGMAPSHDPREARELDGQLRRLSHRGDRRRRVFRRGREDVRREAAVGFTEAAHQLSAAARSFAILRPMRWRCRRIAS